MNGYMLIWILLQKIEELQNELNTYKKNNTDKNWFISSGQFPTCPVFYAKKRYVIPTSHIKCCYHERLLHLSYY